MRELVSVEHFIERLSDEDYILVEYSRRGNTVEKMLVVYYFEMNENRYQVFRVDMSHGFLHSDRPYEAKHRVKEKISELPSIELVWRIVDEIKSNWTDMKKAFIRNVLRWKNEKNSG